MTTISANKLPKFSLRRKNLQAAKSYLSLCKPNHWLGTDSKLPLVYSISCRAFQWRIRRVFRGDQKTTRNFFLEVSVKMVFTLT